MYRNFVKKLNAFNEGFIKVEKLLCDVLFIFLIVCLGRRFSTASCSSPLPAGQRNSRVTPLSSSCISPAAILCTTASTWT